MQSYLCLTIRFVQPYYHGRGDGAEPEWPPSPLRLFQALVAAAARRWQDDGFRNSAIPALGWLEQQSERCSPTILAGHARPAQSYYRLYVPDNTADLAVPAWRRGETTKIVTRSEKDVRPMCLSEGGKVHYLFPLANGHCSHLEVLAASARSVTHLGWGVDMVVGDASVKSEAEAAQLAGDVWLPVSDSTGNVLRAPMPGTLDALMAKHRAFLNRISRDDRGSESFNPVPPLTAFRTVGYRRATDPSPRRVAAFALLKPDASGYRAFDAARRGLTVAGMIRHAVKGAAEKTRPDDAHWIDAFVLGHAERRGEQHQPVGANRFAYLPLPSIEFRGNSRARVVGPVRRVLVAVLTDGHQKEINWAGQSLSGVELIHSDGKEIRALLSRLPTNDKGIQCYTGSSSVWSTVTPVVLPGYDDRAHYRRRLRDNSDAERQRRWLAKLHDRVDLLIRKAIGQAGYSDVLRRNAIIEWRAAGFWPGTDLASRYGVPGHLRSFPRYHVRIHWRDANGQPVSVPGPVCIGGGRFFGVGLFAAETST